LQAVGHRVFLAAQFKAGKTTIAANVSRSLLDGRRQARGAAKPRLALDTDSPLAIKVQGRAKMSRSSAT
jgi:hypothetical protein